MLDTYSLQRIDEFAFVADLVHCAKCLGRLQPGLGAFFAPNGGDEFVAVLENGEKLRRLAVPQNDVRVPVELLVGRAPRVSFRLSVDGRHFNPSRIALR
jgi:hypothetical protein